MLKDLLTGRLALVTGAGRGNGAAIARGLAEAGARVIVTDIDTTAAHTVAEGIVKARNLDIARVGPSPGSCITNRHQYVTAGVGDFAECDFTNTAATVTYLLPPVPPRQIAMMSVGSKPLSRIFTPSRKESSSSSCAVKTVLFIASCSCSTLPESCRRPACVLCFPLQYYSTSRKPGCLPGHSRAAQ